MRQNLTGSWFFNLGVINESKESLFEGDQREDHLFCVSAEVAFHEKLVQKLQINFLGELALPIILNHLLQKWLNLLASPVHRVYYLNADFDNLILC